MTPSEKERIERSIELCKAIQRGCGSSSCELSRKHGGQLNNGPCRCSRFDMSATYAATYQQDLELLLKQAEEIERLRAEKEDMRQRNQFLRTRPDLSVDDLRRRRERFGVLDGLDAAQSEIERLKLQRDRLLDHCPDAECMVCGVTVCPHGDALHFHHDGCPSCCTEDSQALKGQSTLTKEKG